MTNLWQWRAKQLGLHTKRDYINRIFLDLEKEISPSAIRSWLNSDDMKCDHMMFMLSKLESDTLFKIAKKRLSELERPPPSSPALAFWLPELPPPSESLEFWA
jgi:hypothetical protein